jgi:O-antigen/teichoic acid export membrane protein
MSTIRRTYKNMLWLASSELVSKASFFVLMVWAARLLTKEGFGVFSLALSVSMIAIVFCDFGISTLTVREVSRNKRDIRSFMKNAMLLKLSLSALVLAVIFLWGFFAGYSEGFWTVLALYIFGVFMVMNDQVYSYFRGTEKMAGEGLIKTLRAFFVLGFGSLSLYFHRNALFFSISLILAELLTLAVSWLAYRAKVSAFKNVKATDNFKATIKEAFPFGIAFVFGSIYLYFGTVLLAYFRPSPDVATFSVAYQIVLALLFIPVVYTSAVFPIMSRFYVSSREKLAFLYERSFKYLLALGVPLAVCFMVFSKRIISFLYGSQYEESGAVLCILSVFIIFKFVNFATGYMLSSSDFQSKRMKSQAIAALMSVAFSLILIPAFGYIGAAFSVIMTEVLLFSLYYFHVSRKIHRIEFVGNFLKACFASLSFVLIGWTGVRMIAAIILSFCIYALIIIILRLFDKEDLRIFKEAVSRKIRSQA